MLTSFTPPLSFTTTWGLTHKNPLWDRVATISLLWTMNSIVTICLLYHCIHNMPVDVLWLSSSLMTFTHKLVDMNFQLTRTVPTVLCTRFAGNGIGLGRYTNYWYGAHTLSQTSSRHPSNWLSSRSACTWWGWRSQLQISPSWTHSPSSTRNQVIQDSSCFHCT